VRKSKGMVLLCSLHIVLGFRSFWIISEPTSGGHQCMNKGQHNLNTSVCEKTLELQLFLIAAITLWFISMISNLEVCEVFARYARSPAQFCHPNSMLLLANLISWDDKTMLGTSQTSWMRRLAWSILSNESVKGLKPLSSPLTLIGRSQNDWRDQCFNGGWSSNWVRPY
jgi:hypothetical protein